MDRYGRAADGIRLKQCIDAMPAAGCAAPLGISEESELAELTSLAAGTSCSSRGAVATPVDAWPCVCCHCAQPAGAENSDDSALREDHGESRARCELSLAGAASTRALLEEAPAPSWKAHIAASLRALGEPQAAAGPSVLGTNASEMEVALAAF